ncbi:tryptophan synthase subunit alpha [Evansella clarkii]|uniref:tryptophan synthase subunit alpha n=1 Tax=Evansella clarkii TaxID=79879 RepID=UPI001116D015|nr:tryptophan synthase subunit alpha [Evansella clarkii]
MSRLLTSAFKDQKNLFVPYIMAGDPNLEASIDIALALQESGAHALEWGVPFSDPLADGPVIQAAGDRARKNGMTILKAIDGVKEARKKGLEIPVVLFTYINPILAAGEEEIIKKMREAEIDGLLVPDLPAEESGSVRELCQNADISLISLVALSSLERMEKISSVSEGFLYFVSSYGVTGVRENFSEKLPDTLEYLKTKTDIPVLIGFGISKKEHVNYFNSISDGVIVGSALVKIIAKNEKQLIDEKYRKDALNEINEFVTELIS